MRRTAEAIAASALETKDSLISWLRRVCDAAASAGNGRACLCQFWLLKHFHWSAIEGTSKLCSKH